MVFRAYPRALPLGPPSKEPRTMQRERKKKEKEGKKEKEEKKGITSYFLFCKEGTQDLVDLNI